MLAGCRKDLCYNHDEHAITVKVDAVPTWEQEWERPYGHSWVDEWETDWTTAYDDLRPDIADGVRIVVYDADANEHQGETNLPAAGGRILSLSEGTHDLLCYNNDTEYIVFSDFSVAANATATTRTLSRASYKALHAEERTVNQPDMLYGHFEDDHVARRTLEPVQLAFEMRPLVYTYLVRYEFSAGLNYVALARGAIAGMAESVYLQDGHTGSKAATLLYDCTMEDFGAMALVQSFGVSDHPGDFYEPTRAPRTYSMNLEVRLGNGKIKTFEFDITAQMERQPRGGVIIVRDIVVTPEDAGGGGFEVNVDGWGEYQDVELPPLS